MSDDELNQAIKKPGESAKELSERVFQEIPVFSGEDDIVNVARWFADQVGYSVVDKEEIISTWKRRFGLT